MSETHSKIHGDRPTNYPKSAHAPNRSFAPEKPTFSISKARVHVDIWENFDSSGPYWRSKLSVTRDTEGIAGPSYERVQTLVTTFDGDTDEFLVATLLMKEALEWIERRRKEIAQTSNKKFQQRLKKRKRNKRQIVKFTPVEREEFEPLPPPEVFEENGLPVDTDDKYLSVEHSDIPDANEYLPDLLSHDDVPTEIWEGRVRVQ